MHHPLAHVAMRCSTTRPSRVPLGEETLRKKRQVDPGAFTVISLPFNRAARDLDEDGRAVLERFGDEITSDPPRVGEVTVESQYPRRPTPDPQRS